jgi:CubicO group peptidase (beta-lactamase class C family)
LLYLNDGEWDGNQIISSDWVDESFQTYSKRAWKYRVGSNFDDVGYGYQWWAVTAGDYRYNLAWGHGGQQIAVLDDLDLVVVVKADPLWGQHGDTPWKHERANLNLVADFIASLPKE